MKKFLPLFAGLMLCLGSFTYLQAQKTYVTSEACKVCHPNHFTDWAASGHPYKFTITNGQAPEYPPEAVNFQDSWLDTLGDGTRTWDDIAGVIGGYGWKARFVGKDGHLIGTAGSSYSDAGLGHNQINFYDGEFHNWSNYHPNDVKIYNYSCFKCHTTGGDTTGTWLADVPGLGTFSEGGVGCEGCHGPGSEHVAGPTKQNIDKVYEMAHLDNGLGGLSKDGVVQMPDPNGNDVNFMCGTCHNRSYTDPINSSGGFIRHHEQWDEFSATKHSDMGFTCVTCHNPHKRVIWDGDGITKSCTTCHPNEAAALKHAPGASCIDCHMPYAAKSGTKIGQSGYRGDVRSHLFAINTSTESMFTDDGSAVKDDVDRSAALSPHFSCLGCHNDSPDDAIPNFTPEEAADYAAGMHTIVGVEKVAEPVLTMEVYPNPAVENVEISYILPRAENVSVTIFNTSGQEVYSNAKGHQSAGVHTLYWTRGDLESGIYYVTVRGDNVSLTEKLILFNK